jgi:16S rRNA (guanine(527)-N(7))-methyltransferase RsmG
MKPTLDHFIRLFRQCDLDLSSLQYELFWRFHLHLQKDAKEMDLTRIRRFEDLVIKHYVDCALVPKYVSLVSPVLDIGTGAGFPGIPIKILLPDIQMILAEGRRHRVTFLKDVCRLLGLEGIRIHPHKVSSAFPETVDTVITRAFEPISETLRRVGGFLHVGGRAIFMKGPSCDEEIDKAVRRYNLEYRLTDDIPYVIPSTKHQRRLVIFRRTGELMTYSPGKNKDLAIKQQESGLVETNRIKEISSQANETFKTFLKSLSGKGIKKHRMALISGPKQVRDIINDYPERCRGWLMHTRSEDFPEDLPAHTIIYRLHPELFRQLDIFGTKKPLLQVQVEAPMPWQDENWPQGCTLFLACQDPDNVGAIIRSAAAFGVNRVVILKEAANPFHPKSIRAAGSALFRLPILSGPSINDLTSVHDPLIGLSPEGEDAATFQFPETFGLIPGLEGKGLPKRLRQGPILSIPMAEKIESLNTAVATAIVLYLYKRQRMGVS